MTERIQEIRRLHLAWEHLTGQRLTLDMFRERAWYDWLERGMGETELAMLVGDRQAKIRAGKGSPAGLRFRYLVGDPNQAEEDVAELKARRRGGPTKEQRAKDDVLRASGRPDGAATQHGPTTAAEAVERLQDREVARKALKEWLEANK